MRVWDLPPTLLCDRHLLAEHREIHAIWTILTKNKKGYSKHSETLRWRGRLKALYKRHELVVSEFSRRRFRHNSPIDSSLARGEGEQSKYVDTEKEQMRILRNKGCECRV